MDDTISSRLNPNRITPEESRMTPTPADAATHIPTALDKVSNVFTWTRAAL